MHHLNASFKCGSLRYAELCIAQATALKKRRLIILVSKYEKGEVATAHTSLAFIFNASEKKKKKVLTKRRRERTSFYPSTAMKEREGFLFFLRVATAHTSLAFIFNASGC